MNIPPYCIESNGTIWGFWNMCREFTTSWGCNHTLNRLTKHFGKPDIAFGKTDGINKDIVTVDINAGVEPTYCNDWAEMEMFSDNQFDFGLWDPPYDKMYLKEYKEIWRCCKKLAILHTNIYPKPKNSRRVAMIAISYGYPKKMRCLQIFEKKLFKTL